MNQKSATGMIQQFQLDGKVSLVTGASRGIGLAMAEGLAGAGADLVIVGRKIETLTPIAERVANETDRKILPIQADVSNLSEIDALVAQTVETFGRLDVLVNNAGVFPVAPMLEMQHEEFDLIYQVNSRGLAYCSQAVGRRMVEQGTGGAIINLASVDGFRPSFVGLAAYNMAKGGVVMFTKALALELAPHQIRVNAIAPGGISTEGTAELRAALTDDDRERMAAGPTRMIPLGHRSGPDEIAKAAVFLASDGSSFVTGEPLVVDGGFLLG